MFTASSDTSDSDDTADQHPATAKAPVTKTGSPLSIQGCPVRGLREDVLPHGESWEKLLAFFNRQTPLQPRVSRLATGQNKTRVKNFSS